MTLEQFDIKLRSFLRVLWHSIVIIVLVSICIGFVCTVVRAMLHA